MRDAWLGSKRGEWVAYLKAVDREKKAHRYSGSHYDDGMCHGIIPFGAVHHWRNEAERRQVGMLSQPLSGRVLGMDEMGAALAVTCPYGGTEQWYWMMLIPGTRSGL